MRECRCFLKDALLNALCMKHIHWGFMIAAIVSTVVWIIVFFQNYQLISPALWSVLFSPQLYTTSGTAIISGFIGGFLTATLFSFAVKGGRYDPSPSVHGKESPDVWERMADQN